MTFGAFGAKMAYLCQVALRATARLRRAKWGGKDQNRQKAILLVCYSSKAFCDFGLYRALRARTGLPVSSLEA